jgi:hypothetical protein
VLPSLRASPLTSPPRSNPRSKSKRAAGPDYQTLQFIPAQTTTTYDPTADILPEPSETPEGQQAQSAAKTYFQSRPIHVTEATGTDTAADLAITVQIALDPQASLLFTFITGLSD